MSETASTPHAPEAGIEPDGLDTPQIVMWGFISVMIVVGVMLGAAALFNQVQSNLNQERIVAPTFSNVEETVTAQQGLLADYAPPATEGGSYRIPIELAEKLVLRDLKKEQDK
jgi:hypothetical protein